MMFGRLSVTTILLRYCLPNLIMFNYMADTHGEVILLTSPSNTLTRNVSMPQVFQSQGEVAKCLACNDHVWPKFLIIE